MTDMLRVIEPADTVKVETFDDRWARWQEKGARHDAQVRRRVGQLAKIAAIALGIGAMVYWSFSG
ncbi:MAG: hypothetical protein ACRDGM_08730 [bacterium]